MAKNGKCGCGGSQSNGGGSGQPKTNIYQIEDARSQSTGGPTQAGFEFPEFTIAGFSWWVVLIFFAAVYMLIEQQQK